MNLKLLIDKICRDKGFDLSGYKESTLTRRIERRIRFDGAASLEEYIRMIDRDYHLYWRLISDFFIGVTDFFRDREIWKVVQDEILPEIVGRRTLDAGCNNNTSRVPRLPMRIWSAGCSTGEETYSLAIAVKEVLRKASYEPPVFIYGTDIMEDKLEQAKRGIYSEEKLKDVGANLRFRYFERTADSGEQSSRASKGRSDLNGYRIEANTKRITLFRKYDLARPETLAGFDMIVCRNVLIYFQRGLQDKVITHFHKALCPGGILWLGKAESLSDETKPLFEPVYKNEKIFGKV